MHRDLIPKRRKSRVATVSLLSLSQRPTSPARGRGHLRFSSLRQNFAPNLGLDKTRERGSCRWSFKVAGALLNFSTCFASPRHILGHDASILGQSGLQNEEKKRMWQTTGKNSHRSVPKRKEAKRSEKLEFGRCSILPSIVAFIEKYPHSTQRITSNRSERRAN